VPFTGCLPQKRITPAEGTEIVRLKGVPLEMSILNSLQKSAVFDGLSREQYENVIRNGFVKKLRPNRILFHQGAPAERCYLVNRGRLQLTKLNEHGKEAIFRYIEDGELTAVAAVLKGWTYPVMAESVKATEVIGWDKPTILGLIRNHPDVAINILSVILERLDEVQHRFLELHTEHVEQRVARTLLRLMRRTGSKTSEGVRIDLALSRQNIAEFSGTTIYTVSRSLSAWEKNGWVQSGRRRITVIDPHALMMFAENG
jgi:CRP-like cAMP-binding protein